MNGIRRKILALALVFIPAFVICLLAYPHVQPQYQKAVVAVIDVGLHHVDPPMRIEITEHGGWSTFTLRPDGTESFYWSRPGHNLTLFYMGLALLPALLFATPVSLRRRVRLLVIGMLVLFALQVVAGFGLVLSIRCLANDPDAMICTWTKTIGNTFGQVSAFVIWVGLTWQAWFAGTETTAGANPSRSIGRGILARNPAITFAGLFSATVLIAAYAGHSANGFHLNDADRIVDNLSIRSLRNTGAFFSDPQTLSTRPEDAAYRPLLTLSHAVDYWAAGGLKARQFHRTQFALLVALGAVLALMFKRLSDLGRSSPANRYTAVVAALLFCVHVANTGTVHDISSRPDLLGALGIAACFYLYLAWPQRRRTGWFLVPMLVGALVEPLTLLFAPLFVIFVWLFEEKRSLAGLLRHCSPALGLGLAIFVFVSWMDASAASPVANHRWMSDWIDQPFVWFRHACVFFFPVGGPVAGQWSFLSEMSVLRVLVGAVFLIVLVFAIGWFSRSKTLRPTAFGLFWFALASAAVSSRGTAVDGPIGNPAFLPYVGLTFAVVWLAASGLRRLHDRGLPAIRPIAAGAALAVVALHSVATHERNSLWRDDETLWAAVLQNDADDGRGLLNYGRALSTKGRHDEAVESFERAQRRLTGSTVVERDLALSRAALSQGALAESHFRQARSHGAFARWLVTQARGPEAIEQLGVALQLSPNDAGTRWLQMNLYAASGNEAALSAAAEATLAILPTDHVALAYTTGRIPIWASVETADAYADLGRRKTEGRYWLDATLIYRHAVRLDPSAAEHLNYLAWTRMRLGFHEEAIAAYREVLAIDPASAQVWNDMGWAQTRLERFDAAVASFETAIELDPTMSRARGNLDWARRQAVAERAGTGATE